MGLYIFRVSISLCLTSVMHCSLCYPSFYLTWSHFRSVWVYMLPEFLCHFSLTSVLYGYLCCPSFYVSWSHFRSVWVSMLSEFLCRLVSLPVCMGIYVARVSVTQSHFRSVWVSMLPEFLCHLVSLPFCMDIYVARVSMSLGLSSVLYRYLCCPSFYVAWSHFRWGLSCFNSESLIASTTF